jgi:hypothetical protein
VPAAAFPNKLHLLQSLSAQLRSRELSLADAESQLAAKDEALAAAGQETANMHKVGQFAQLFRK